MCLEYKNKLRAGLGVYSRSGSMSKVNGEPLYGDDPNKPLTPSEKSTAQSRSQRQGISPDPDLNTEKVDSRPTRKKWPKDRAKKLAAMAKVMPEYLMAYHGNVTPIASAMSVTPVDVREVIHASPELIELQEISTNSVEALLLDHGLHVALTSKNIAGVKWALEVRFPEKYGKGATATKTKGKGFEAPTDEADDLKPVWDKKPNKSN